MEYYKPGKYSKAIAAELSNREKLEKQGIQNIEKEYGGQLHMLGRNALFTLIFESKKFEQQEINKIGTFEDVTQTHHFIEGVQRGLFLYEIGIIPEEFKSRQQILIDNGMIDEAYQNAVNYLIETKMISVDYLKNTKKHR